MEFVLPLLGFVFVSTITPGPNNLLLAASGIQFGFRATMPHMLGIHCGIYALTILCGLGLGQVIIAFEGALVVLKIVASGYLLYLAVKISGIRFDEEDRERDIKPMSVVQAGIFQFVNPKAWMMALTGLNISLQGGIPMPGAVLSLCVGFATLGFACNCLWVVTGASLRQAMLVPAYRRLINGSLVAVTLATVLMLWSA